MIVKQVIFKDLFENDSFPTGGIAIYEDFGQGADAPFLELQGVICGECGSWIETEDVEIISTLDKWWSIDEAISQNFYPDGTRGFRPENQIKMELD